MEEHLPNDPFESFLQDHLQGHEEVPPDDPWEDIELTLAIEQTDREANRWMWFMLSFFLIIMIGTGLTWYMIGSNETLSSSPVLSTTTATPQTNSTPLEDNINSQEELITNQTTHSTESSTLKEDTNELATEAQLSMIQGSTTGQTNQQNNMASDLSEDQGDAKDQRLNSSTLEAPTVAPIQESGSVLPSSTLESIINQIPESQIQQSKPDSKEPANLPTSEGLIIAETEDLKEDKDLEAPQESIASEEDPAPIKLDEAPTRPLITAFNTLTPKAGQLSISDRAFPEKLNIPLSEIEAIDQGQNRTFFTEAHLGLMATTHRFTRDNLPSRVDNQREVDATTWQTGVTAGVELSQHIGVFSGVYLTQQTFNTQRLGRQLFRQYRRDLSDRDQNQYTFEYSTATPGGVADVQFRTSQTDPNRITPDREVLIFRTNLQTTITQASFPLGIRLQSKPGKWRVAANFGILGHLTTNAKTEVTSIESLNNQFRILDVERRLVRTPKVRSFTSDLFLNAQLIYQPWRKMYLHASPNLWSSLRTLNGSALVDTKSVSIGGSIGLGVRF